MLVMMIPVDSATAMERLGLRETRESVVQISRGFILDHEIDSPARTRSFPPDAVFATGGPRITRFVRGHTDNARIHKPLVH